MNYSKVTYAKPGPQNFKANCRKLADILENEVTDEQFEMSTYGRSENACGTVGCALGWAAMSNRFKGLQYMKIPCGDNCVLVDCVMDGQRASWQSAAHRFFGGEVTVRIFHGSLWDREEVVHALRDYAET